MLGTVVVFIGAYMVEKTKGFAAGRSAFHFLAMLPMAVPGMVLGLAYIFFFNNPANPLNVIYGTMAILVHLHGHALLHRGAPDRADRAEADGRRVRAGRRPR